MDPILPELRTALNGLTPKPPTIPVITTTVENADAATLFDANHWVANLRNPVRFRQARSPLRAPHHTTSSRVSPHPLLTKAISDTLSGCASSQYRHPAARHPRHARPSTPTSTPPTSPSPPHTDHPPEPHAAIPTTPWQHSRYWVDTTHSALPTVHAPVGRTPPTASTPTRQSRSTGSTTRSGSIRPLPTDGSTPRRTRGLCSRNADLGAETPPCHRCPRDGPQSGHCRGLHRYAALLDVLARRTTTCSTRPATDAAGRCRLGLPAVQRGEKACGRDAGRGRVAATTVHRDPQRPAHRQKATGPTRLMPRCGAWAARSPWSTPKSGAASSISTTRCPPCWPPDTSWPKRVLTTGRTRSCYRGGRPPCSATRAAAAAVQSADPLGADTSHLVVGATGHIGPHLIRQLADMGAKTIVAVSRNPGSPARRAGRRRLSSAWNDADRGRRRRRRRGRDDGAVRPVRHRPSAARGNLPGRVRRRPRDACAT